MIAGHTPSGTWRHTLDYGRITCLSCSVLTHNFALGKRKSLRILKVAIRRFFVYYLFDPAAPCSYSLPVSAAPAVPLAIPFFLAISAASSGFVPVCPGSVIFSLISLLTAVGSCSFIFAGVIGSFSLYDVNGSSLMPISVPAAPCSYAALPLELEEVSFELVLLVTLSLVVSPTSFTLSLAPVTVPLTLSIILPIIILYTLRY